MSFLYFANAQCIWNGLINNIIHLEETRFSIFSYGKIVLCPGAPMDAEWTDADDLHDAKVLMEAAFKKGSEFSIRVIDKQHDVGFVCTITTEKINITVPESSMSQEEFERATMELLFQLGAKVEEIEFSDDMVIPPKNRRSQKWNFPVR